MRRQEEAQRCPWAARRAAAAAAGGQRPPPSRWKSWRKAILSRCIARRWMCAMANCLCCHSASTEQVGQGAGSPCVCCCAQPAVAVLSLLAPAAKRCPACRRPSGMPRPPACPPTHAPCRCAPVRAVAMAHLPDSSAGVVSGQQFFIYKFDRQQASVHGGCCHCRWAACMRLWPLGARHGASLPHQTMLAMGCPGQAPMPAPCAPLPPPLTGVCRLAWRGSALTRASLVCVDTL